MTPPRFLRHLLADDDLADGCERDFYQLEMRPAEGNADDGDEAGDPDDEMGDGEPDSGEQEPDDIADEAERPGADIVLACQLAPADRLVAEGKEGEDRDIEGGP